MCFWKCSTYAPSLSLSLPQMVSSHFQWAQKTVKMAFAEDAQGLQANFRHIFQSKHSETYIALRDSRIDEKALRDGSEHLAHTHTYTRTHGHTHTHTNAWTHTRTHACTDGLKVSLSQVYSKYDSHSDAQQLRSSRQTGLLHSGGLGISPLATQVTPSHPHTLTLLTCISPVQGLIRYAS